MWNSMEMYVDVQHKGAAMFKLSNKSLFQHGLSIVSDFLFTMRIQAT